MPNRILCLTLAFSLVAGPAFAIPIDYRIHWHDGLTPWLIGFAITAVISGVMLHAAKPPNLAFANIRSTYLSKKAQVYYLIYMASLAACAFIYFVAPLLLGGFELRRTEDIFKGLENVITREPFVDDRREYNYLGKKWLLPDE